jgi:KUP system potassium uptake protein
MDTKHDRRQYLLLSLSALGVVFGDIGTSPLYAVRECFSGAEHLAPTPENVLGVLSLIVWSLITVVSLKYLVIVLRADNQGEGGILALMALALPSPDKRTSRWILAALGIFGAALLYGDGVITPAISVLSAVEGLGVATPAFEPWVVPIAIGILFGLFVIQRRGTAKVGGVFGPLILLWFLTIASLGVGAILRRPEVLKALSPYWAAHFFVEHHLGGITILGIVFLVVTGGEAIYADMGHFGSGPIRLAWSVVVLPALLCSYFGQGALILEDTRAVANPFYLLAASWMRYPLVALATMATVIASQAVISGAFSLARQAVQLGYTPRLHIVHTSEHHHGQIYVPLVNWLLFVAVIGLVLGFGSSSALASAYGIAVTTTMAITTILTYVVAREQWEVRRVWALPVVAFFLTVDLAFFGANILKVADGGWLPLSIAAGVFLLMTTWSRGRKAVGEHLRSQAVPLSVFLREIDEHPPVRVSGTAVFMAGLDEGTPATLLHNLKHNRVLHERVVLLTIRSLPVPEVPERERVDIHDLGHGILRVTARYGFMESPEIGPLLEICARQNLDLRGQDTTYFLGQQHIVFRDGTVLPRWRQGIFLWLSRNARSATESFGIPANQVVHLGAVLSV